MLYNERMNKVAPEDNQNPLDKALEEILASIPSSDRSTVQTLLDRAVEAALAEAEKRHEQILGGL